MMEYIVTWSELLAYSEWLNTQHVEVQIAVGIVVVVVAFFGVFVFKNVLILLLRRFGLSKVTTYGWFPRLPWRSVMRVYMSFGRWKEHVFKLGNHSSGGFASVLSTLTNTYTPSKIPLGLPWVFGVKLFQTIGLSISTHLLCIAQSGGGKSVWLKNVIQNWYSSAYIIDPKGECWRDLARSDKKRQWVVLRPYHPETTGFLNPLDCLHDAYLRGGESEAIRWAYRIGQGFIPSDSQSRTPFFADTSRGYFVGVMLFVYGTYPKEQVHLGTVRDLIIHGIQIFNDDGALENTSAEGHQLLHKLMMESPLFSGAIAGAAAPFINAGSETLGNLQATLQERTKVLDIPSVRHMLSKTTRPLHELKTCNDFVLDVDATVTSIREELKDLTRLITNLVIYTFEAIKGKHHCLMVVEELNAQEFNQVLDSALPVIRSMFLHAILIIQDMPSAQKWYKESALSFVGNATATVWLPTNHPDNLSLLARILGKKTLIEKDKRTGRKTYREVDVATPEQLGRFLSTDSGNMIVTRSGRALRLKLDPHYKALPVWAYDADPDHKESLLRRITRFFLNPLPKNQGDSQ